MALPSVDCIFDWKVYYAYFARWGFFPLARRDAQEIEAMLVNIRQLKEGLPRAGR
jgi:hypothetical protein